MRIDVTSMFFNSKIEGQTATPAWGTSIGQNQSRECRIDDFKKEVVDMVIGMTYKSISDRSKLDVSKGSSSREIISAALFTDVYINEKKIENTQFVLILVREHTKHHEGRLIISYAPYISYNKISNQSCINKMQEALGCSEEGCWFVYDISIINQSELHFKAVVVNQSAPMIYKNSKSQNRSEEWRGLIPEDEHYQALYKKTSLAQNSTQQIIFYGAPGTGKSYGLKDLIGTKDGTKEGSIREDNNIRVTFHPDTDYASFVGCYKPMQQEDNEENIVYEYQQEAFINAYLQAWDNYENNAAENFYLVIEEINRGNCAQIFGDMFQLLDRDEKGFSSYKVSTDMALRRYLSKELQSEDFVGMPSDLRSGYWMQLPPNLCILATMNTSDQSLFPMDSAFKRRWEWKYVKIDTSKVANVLLDVNGIHYQWSQFLDKINEFIQKETGSTAKQIGPWFAKADMKAEPGADKPTMISYDNFRSKVLFFLFNDALRDYDNFGQLFRKEDDNSEYPFLFENLFSGDKDGTDRVELFLKNLGVDITNQDLEEGKESENEPSIDSEEGTND